MASARRILTYGTALVGLFAALYAASNLLSLLLATPLLRGSLPDGSGDIRRERSALKYLSTTVILLAVAITHALLLRADLRIKVMRRVTPRLRALVAAGAEEALLALRRCSDRPIEVLGQLSALEDMPGKMDLTLLQRMVATLGTVEQEGCDSVLVLVRLDGGSLLRYTSASA